MWTVLAAGLAEGASFSETVTGLDPETPYSWKLKAVNNLETPTDSEIAEGSFTTGGTGAGGTGGAHGLHHGSDFVVLGAETHLHMAGLVFAAADRLLYVGV